ncbi:MULTISPECIES: hypothetical protein [unclassified Oleiphilus]|uniref:hypothetical protein n=5 Tax=Oleiphilus TaxID=141450 RepID=UPI0007C40664|nr:MULTISPECIES: hypothetical protein [unclassified Oleiphilus]KZY41463.1 hypothetical protein A3732_18110 [Oleiphilus sp. HI0050]KZY76694.1 hypothetical protein A3740_12110 [Oleiphilus sp. HI0068]KZY86180.1 hypothetical protein A3741_14565 [Oleiphilus sp. HI0069]KZZ45965.1 hypothetical protein A3755_02955 [Oleiphilus sp. HI0085]KZY60490.1 hypothetical protein A3735_12310 [Oleiphilus sp. HI0061]
MSQPDKDLQDDPLDSNNRKQKRVHALIQWWQQEKDKIAQGDVLKFMHENKERLEKSLASIYQNNFVYRVTNLLLAFVASLAGLVDRLKDAIVKLVLKVPAPEAVKGLLLSIFNAVKLRGIVDFFRAKMYSLKKAPHNIRAVQLMDEVVARAKRDGLDIKKHFPDIARKFNERKLQLLQHSFFKEFSKSRIERILAMPFTFSRSISPVLPDTALWHKFFVFLENRNIADLILVGSKGERVSTKHDSKHVVGSSEVVRILYQASVLKASGRRVFIVGNHEGYIGPYLVRSILRRLGFDNLTANCNTVVGPRMFSNMVLKNGASNVGNLFLTLPSQKTTEVKEKSLADALLKTARRSQLLIKMPNSGLHLIEQMSYSDFMNKFIRSDRARFSQISAQLMRVEKHDLAQYLADVRQTCALDELDREDYELFKSIMYEPFLIFPEGSRSYVAKDGSVTMKYVSPRFVQAYFRPDDVVLPISLVGGSDIGNSWRLKPANIGLCVGEPIKVSEEMIANFDTEGVGIMRKVAALPNIKTVNFDEDIQAGKKLESHAA